MNIGSHVIITSRDRLAGNKATVLGAVLRTCNPLDDEVEVRLHCNGKKVWVPRYATELIEKLPLRTDSTKFQKERESLYAGIEFLERQIAKDLRQIQETRSLIKGAKSKIYHAKVELANIEDKINGLPIE
jgi:hypothetical protein